MIGRSATIAGFGGLRLMATKDLARNFFRHYAATPQLQSPDVESTDVQRARLLYQSKKRGILENDIIIGDFAVENLPKLSVEELHIYDRIINGDHNEWDLYYYFVGRKEPPPELKDCALFKRMQEYAVHSSAADTQSAADETQKITEGDNTAATSEQLTAGEEPKFSKKTFLLAVDAKITKLIPEYMKKNLSQIQEIMDPNVEVVDKKNGVHLKGIMDLQIHLAKIRLYFRWKSPFNKIDLLGTAVYDEGNYVTALYRMTTLKTGLTKRYNPLDWMLRKKLDTRLLEGALDMYLNESGYVKKIVHRETTFQDVESAKAFSILKQESEEDFRKRFEEESDPFRDLKAANKITNWRDFFKQPKPDA